jgi:RNA polymerase sigma-70 factor, ECF subfamily
LLSRGYTSGFGAQPVELYSFDDAYVRRLREGDPSTENHFVSYFNQLLFIKLRARYLSPDSVADLRQETLARVFRALRSEGGIRQPERLGAFVNSVCNNVLQEHYRASSRGQPLEESHLEASGKVLNLEGLLISKQTGQRVRQVLQSIPSRDRELLRAIFFEEKDKAEVCRQFGVDRDYLRVLLHRAKEKFRQALQEQGSPLGREVL